jgi:hypothetical protein
MIHFYYIILIILSSIGTLYVPKLWTRYKQYYTEIKHQRQQALRNMIKEEIKNVLLELKNEQ